MRALITGANGTIGKELKRYLEFQGVEVYTWDRTLVPIYEYNLMEEFIQKINPDVIYHLAIASTLVGVDNETWRTNYEWPSEIAWICRIQQIKFIFASTYEIFSDYNMGPFTLETKPDAFEGFGFEKRMAEERVMYQNPHSIIVRLPWQIVNEPNKNGMLIYLDKEMEKYDKITASSNYYPCCAFLEDTVKEIYRISNEYNSGKFMIDSNDGLNFYDIVNKLKYIYGKTWNVVEDTEYSYNQCMHDDRCKIEMLSASLDKKLKNIQLKSKKKLGILGEKYIKTLVEAYEKLGYQIDTLVVKNPENYTDFVKLHNIPNCTNEIDSLADCDQILVVNINKLNYDFLEKYKDKKIIFSGLPYLKNKEEYLKYKNLFENSNFYVLLEFNQLLTTRKIQEKLENKTLGKIHNIYLDVAVKNEKTISKNFQEVLINPLSFIHDHFKKFKLIYSDYNKENESLLTHHSNGEQRMTINFFKLWDDGIKMLLRIIGDKGEIRVEGNYTNENGWGFRPIIHNDIEYGQGEYSSTAHEILELALQEYLKKLEDLIYHGKENMDIYTAKDALSICDFFLEIENFN